MCYNVFIQKTKGKKMKLTNAELKRIVELAEFILEGEEMPQDYNELLAWGKSYLQDVDAWTPQNTRKVFM